MNSDIFVNEPETALSIPWIVITRGFFCIEIAANFFIDESN